MSSLAQMMASGLPLAARPASVTVRRLGTGEVGSLLEDDLVLVGHAVEHVVDALVAVDRRAGAGLALQMEQLGAVRERRDHRLRFGLAALGVVGADMGEDAFDAVDAAVDGDDRNAGLYRLLDGRRQRVDVKRRDDDGVDLLDDRRFDVGGLLGRRVLAVALDQVDALRLGLQP